MSVNEDGSYRLPDGTTATPAVESTTEDGGTDAGVDRREKDIAELTCEEMKENLQDEFEDAYIEIKKLKEEAEEETKDKECDLTAHTMHDAAVADLTPQREHATDKLETATIAMASVRPIYELMIVQVRKLAHHVAILEIECEDNELVQKFLEQLTDLIIETLRCPEMEDLNLSIPEPDDPKSPAIERQKAREEEAMTEERVEERTQELVDDTMHDIPGAEHPSPPPG